MAKKWKWRQSKVVKLRYFFATHLFAIFDFTLVSLDNIDRFVAVNKMIRDCLDSAWAIGRIHTHTQSHQTLSAIVAESVWML